MGLNPDWSEICPYLSECHWYCVTFFNLKLKKRFKSSYEKQKSGILSVHFVFKPLLSYRRHTCKCLNTSFVLCNGKLKVIFLYSCLSFFFAALLSHSLSSFSTYTYTFLSLLISALLETGSSLCEWSGVGGSLTIHLAVFSKESIHTD